MFACLVYSLDSPKGVRGQLCRGRDDLNMAHSSFLSCIKPTFVIVHGGGYAALRHTVAHRSGPATGF
jgi:hypothetical protein